MKMEVFVKSNKMLECKLKLNRREGKENVKRKPVIQKEDIEKLKSNPELNCNPLQPAFFQRPSPKAKESDMIW